ncbi:MAG: S41 family peptidase [Burkholderiaceae bacterium]
MRSLLATLAFAVLLAACAPLPTRDLRASPGEIVEVTAHPTPLPSTTGFAPANETAALRTDTVDRIWKTIDDFYYDPGFNGVDVVALQKQSLADATADSVKSDAQFYRALKREVRALHDSHTLILTPREAEDSRARRATQIGLVFTVSEGRVVVTGVVAGFPADVAGVRPGMIVEAVDDRKVDAAFFDHARIAQPEPVGSEPSAVSGDDAERSLRLRAVRALLVSTDGDPRSHRLTLLRADDTTLQVDITARGGDVPTRESLTTLPSGIDVLRLSRFDSSVRDQLARDIDASRQRSRGLILDLRGNPGGEQRLFQWLVGRFVPRRTELGETRERAGSNPVMAPMYAEPASHPYLKPIALLIDRSTASAAELTAHALVEQRDAIAVGEATCGCVVAIRYDYVLPDGGALHVAQVGFRTAKGRRMEADPLMPAIAVTPTLAERRTDGDVVLQAAERALLAH